ncbi:MAG: hypothetical protein ABMB14_35625, partial [Myxococcota bacterium]
VHRCPVGGGESVPTILARSLGIRRAGRRTEEVVGDVGRVLAIRGKVLVYLDAPQPHLGLPKLVHTWMPSAPILVAATGPLDLPGERVIRLGALGTDEAVELLRQRVAAARPGTVLDDDMATAIAARLDRMPEALEAAAARTAFVAPGALLEQLDRGEVFDEDGLDANLAAAIKRLDRVERAALDQCVVFRDGFDLAAAEAVIDLGDRGRAMIGVIEALCARSLLRIASDGDSANVRWTVYETVKAYVRRGMSASAVDAAHARHASWYGKLGLRLGSGPWLERPELAVVLRERENLRGVLQQGGTHAAGAAVGLTAILGREPAGPLAEAVERLLADPALAEPTAARWRSAAHLASARTNLYLGHPLRARVELRAAATDAPGDDARVLVEIARLYTELASASESVMMLHRVSTADPWVLAVAAWLRGRNLATTPEARKAERAFVEALHGFGVLDADLGRAHTQRQLAEVLAAAGQGRRAAAQLGEAIAVFDGVGDAGNTIQARMRLAELLVGLGLGEEATAQLERVMEAARVAAANGLLAQARGLMGVVRTMAHDWDEAERLFYLALAGAAPDPKRIQALFALHRMLRGDADTAHDEAKGAVPDPIAVAMVAALERQPAPHADDEAFLVWEALEAWRAAASMTRIEAAVSGRASLATRMVLACPRRRPQRKTA